MSLKLIPTLFPQALQIHLGWLEEEGASSRFLAYLNYGFIIAHFVIILLCYLSNHTRASYVERPLKWVESYVVFVAGILHERRQ